MLTISFTPTSTAAAAFNLASKERKTLTPNGKKEPRRARVEKNTPKTGAPIELIVENIKDNSLGSNFIYKYLVNSPDILIGERAYSNGLYLSQVMPLQISIFKAALKTYLPSLDPEIVDSIADEDFQITAISCNYYFQCGNETAAYQSWLNLFNHLKTVLDSGISIPTRKGSRQKYTPRVLTDAFSRSSFIVSLPFGQVKVSINRDGLWPSTFGSIQDQDDRIATIVKSRALLCFEVTVDLQKFQYIDRDGLKTKLPKCYVDWTSSELQEDPMQIVWEAVRWEFWLNVALAMEESEIRREGLSWKFEGLLAAYLAGEPVLRYPYMPETATEVKKWHDVLIQKSGVNFLNPWAINKLNQCQEFGDWLVYTNRFDPAADPDFAEHTLSKINVNQAMKDFDKLMKNKSNWAYIHAE